MSDSFNLGQTKFSDGGIHKVIKILGFWHLWERPFKNLKLWDYWEGNLEGKNEEYISSKMQKMWKCKDVKM